ncbi:hypothetical protein LL912_17665 [Niabella sp. CC-SYL272]|uniref:hypothetical protein n=1 Tax=Niabella agricola TaxID=2891571 RepID=UPI001F25CD47|nr:hypothetical protein [Niabella agricola]MCF3110618.1 hypothetical protein [Niabella agricola]
MKRQAALHPIMQGYKGDPEHACDLFPVKQGLAFLIVLICGRGNIFQAFFNGVPDSPAKISFIR